MLLLLAAGLRMGGGIPVSSHNPMQYEGGAGTERDKRLPRSRHDKRKEIERYNENALALILIMELELR